MAFGNKTAKIQGLEAVVESYQTERKNLIAQINQLKDKLNAPPADIEDDYCPNFYIVTPYKGKTTTIVADGVDVVNGIYTFFNKFPCGHTEVVALYPFDEIKSVVQKYAIYVSAPPEKKTALTKKTDKTADPSI